MEKKLSKAQQLVVEMFSRNRNFDCYIHKHWHSKAWFQVNSRSWHPVSDSTIKALVKRGLIQAKDDTRWYATDKLFNPQPHE